MKPRRIMMTVDAVGGVWRYALDLAAGLHREGVATLLVGLGPGPDHAQESEAEAAPGLTLRWTDLPLDWLAGGPGEIANVPSRLADIANGSGVDLVHLNTPTQLGTGVFRQPVVAASHSCLATWWAAVHPGEDLPEKWTWNAALTGEGLRAADAVLAPSASHAAGLLAAYGPLPRLHVVHNSSQAQFPDVPKQNLVLAAGRWWDPGKNLSVLDEAAGNCAWPVIAAGPLQGPDGNLCQPRHAEAPGSLDRNALNARLAEAAIFASTALYEPFGLAVLEAARASCALVLSDIPTFRELWDGVALFVDPDDPEAVAAGFAALIADPERRHALAAAAQKRAETYSSAAQMCSVLDVYAEAMAAAPELARAV